MPSVADALNNLTDAQKKELIASLGERYLRLRRNRGASTVLATDNTAALVKAVEDALALGARYVQALLYDTVEDAATMDETLLALNVADHDSFMLLFDDVFSKAIYGTPDHEYAIPAITYARRNLGGGVAGSPVPTAGWVTVSGVYLDGTVKQIEFLGTGAVTLASAAIVGAGGVWSDTEIQVPPALVPAVVESSTTCRLTVDTKVSNTVVLVDSPVVTSAYFKASEIAGLLYLTINGTGLSSSGVNKTQIEIVSGAGSPLTLDQDDTNVVITGDTKITIPGVLFTAGALSELSDIKVTADLVEGVEFSPVQFPEVSSGDAYIRMNTAGADPDPANWVEEILIEGVGFNGSGAIITFTGDGAKTLSKAQVQSAGGIWTDTEIVVISNTDVAGGNTNLDWGEFSKVGSGSPTQFAITVDGQSTAAATLGYEPFIAQAYRHREGDDVKIIGTGLDPSSALTLEIATGTGATDSAAKAAITSTALIGMSGVNGSITAAIVDLDPANPGVRMADIIVASATLFASVDETSTWTVEVDGLSQDGSVVASTIDTPWITGIVVGAPAAGDMTISGRGFASAGSKYTWVDIAGTGAIELDQVSIIAVAPGAVGDTSIVSDTTLDPASPSWASAVTSATVYVMEDSAVSLAKRHESSNTIAVT